jgi:isomaltose glucohydrolase
LLASSPQACVPTDLVATSLAVLRAGQHSSGGYVASPNYPTYAYAWLRDGTFCAYAMDICGETDSATAFHDFVARTMNAHADRVASAVAAVANGSGGVDPKRMLPTRYTLTGEVEPTAADAWPNFQLDGYGSWLWGLRDHLRRNDIAPDATVLAAAGLAADYLVATRHLPCYDCWEEYQDRRHTSTLAAVIAGLESASELLDRPELGEHATQLRAELNTRHLRAGAYVKHDATDAVDASLLWLALPFDVIAPDDERMVATAARITTELLGPTGGVRRYLGDSFYGGGEWILLTAWLGWHRATTGDIEGAKECQAWIEQAATSDGHLPEQVVAAPQDPAQVAPWVEFWGSVATPLLWSHAMYLVLDRATGGTA